MRNWSSCFIARKCSECFLGGVPSRLARGAAFLEDFDGPTLETSLDSIYRHRDLRSRRSTKATEHHWGWGSSQRNLNVGINAKLTHSHRKGSFGGQSDVRGLRSIRKRRGGWLLRGAFGSAFLSKVLRSESCPPGDSRQHAGTDLFAIMKCEYIIRPPRTR